MKNKTRIRVTDGDNGKLYNPEMMVKDEWQTVSLNPTCAFGPSSTLEKAKARIDEYLGYESPEDEIIEYPKKQYQDYEIVIGYQALTHNSLEEKEQQK